VKVVSKIPLLGGIAFLGLVLGLFILQNSILLPAPSQDDCKIYRALSADIYSLDSGYTDIFRPDIFKADEEGVREAKLFKSEFSRATEEMETIPASRYGESFETPVRETFNVNLSTYEWVTPKSKKQKLRKCFRGQSKPDFSRLPLSALSVRIKAEAGNEAWPNIWSVSEVHHTKNGKYAILFVNSHCGGLCGWGGVYLFENKDKDWDLIGSNTIWVS